MNKQNWWDENLKINSEPTSFVIGQIEIDLKIGNIKFLKDYKPDKTARVFWEFIDSCRPRFIQDKQKEVLEKVIKPRLEYCRKQNGLPHCKNCGLCEDDFKKLL